MIDHSDVALKGFDDIGEKPVILDDISLELAVDSLQTDLIIKLCFSLHLHDKPDGVDELVLKLTGCFDVFYLLEQQHSLHVGRDYSSDLIILNLVLHRQSSRY